MENIRRRLLGAAYDGSNSEDILAMVQTITQFSGNLWAIQDEADGVLTLRESNPFMPMLYADYVIPTGTYLVVAPNEGILERIPASVAGYRYVSDAVTFLEAVQTPEVIDALKVALGLTE